MKNPLQLLLHVTSTRSVQRVGLTVNVKLKTQLTSVYLEFFSKQMLQYSTTHQLFLGDEKMRASTVQTRRKHRRVTGELECLDNITYSMFDAAHNKPSTRSGSERLCGYLTEFKQHVES